MPVHPTDPRAAPPDPAATTATLADPAASPAVDLVGLADSLGLPERFQVVGMLGRGGMGVVLEAYDSRLGRSVAIKALSGMKMYDAAARARFQREARVAARLSDPSIVTVHELSGTGDYMVMELVRGETLRDRLARALRLPADEVRRLGLVLCRALSIAHAAGVIHRDVKPSNVLLDTDDRIRLADFGIATFSESDITMSGVTVGTPAYMAPEQLRGGAVDARADIYAVGATLFEAATGERLNRPEGACPDPAAAVERVTGDAALAAAIAAAASERPDDRFAAANDLAAALAAPAARAGRRWRPVAIAAVGVALAAGGGAVLWSKGARAPERAKTPAAPTPTTAAPVAAVAVLPFDNRSRDGDLAYARDGLAGILATELGAAPVEVIPSQRVLEEVRGAGDRRAWRDAARRLGAELVVHGSIVDEPPLVWVRIEVLKVDGTAIDTIDRRVSVDGVAAAVRSAAEPIAAMAIGPSGRSRQMELGRAALIADRVGEANRHFATVLFYAPDDAEALYQAALATWWNSTTPDPTLASIDRALAVSQGERQREVLAAMRLLVDVRFPDALAAFEHVAARWPRDVDALYGLFEAEWHAGHPAAAVQTFVRLREVEPRVRLGLMHCLSYALIRPDAPGVEWTRSEMGDNGRNRAMLVRHRIAEGDLAGAERLLGQVAAGMAEGGLEFDQAAIQLALIRGEYDAAAAKIEHLGQPADLLRLIHRLGLAAARGGAVELDRWLSHETMAAIDTSTSYGELAELAALAVGLPEPALHRRVARAFDRQAGWRRRSLSDRLARVLLAGALRDAPAVDAELASPYPEVAAVARALSAERARHWPAAASAWREAAGHSGDGRFLLLERAREAAALYRAGDVSSAAAACEQVIAPRLFSWHWATAVRDCRTWTAQAAVRDRRRSGRTGAAPPRPAR